MSEFDNGHWSFDSQLGGLEYEGFIYVIRDPIEVLYYIGKKSYRTRSGPASNWKRYMTSSKRVKQMMLERPEEHLERIVLEQYKTKGTLSWGEVWSIAQARGPENARCLNVLMSKVSWNCKEKITAKHEQRLEAALNWEDL